MLAAVKEYGDAFIYASKKLQRDREVVLAALASEPTVLREVPSPMNQEPAIILAALRSGTYASQSVEHQKEGRKERGKGA